MLKKRTRKEKMITKLKKIMTKTSLKMLRTLLELRALKCEITKYHLPPHTAQEFKSKEINLSYDIKEGRPQPLGAQLPVWWYL
jgi:hypothetical protein